MNGSSWIGRIIFGGFILFVLLPLLPGMFRVFELAGGPALLPDNPRAIAAPFPILLHIIASVVYGVLCLFQFSTRFRKKHLNLHRLFGRIAATAGLAAAASGLWMTHFYSFPTDLQGAPLYWFRLLIGTAMFGFVIIAIRAIIGRDVMTHRAFMIRAFAIGIGASTQAFFGIFWIIVTGEEALGAFRDAVMIGAWLFNLAVAEFIIRRGQKSNRKTSHRPRSVVA